MSEADLAAGLQRCMFGTAQNYCGKPATTHFLAENEAAMGCDEHPYAEPVLDTHPIGGACGLPDTRWMYSWNAAPADGFCFVDGINANVLADVELMTSGATA